jgi:peptidoglycan hydrolase-like protein with peptidoglycan-binding domain
MAAPRDEENRVRTILGRGATGDIVRTAQIALKAAGYDTRGVDGIYGGNMAAAVAAFQTAQGSTATGTMDDNTWTLLMKALPPPVAHRSLQLTASFENHGFTLAVGNFDGAMLTWGIIGFTMSAGEVQKIVLGVNASNPASVTNAFGDKARTLLSIMQDTHANQLNWANSVTLPNGSLAEPWGDMFAAFGSDPAVQAAQLDIVNKNYTGPAIQTAKRYGLKSELGLALCFDIHVQDGSINRRAAALIQKGRAPEMAESELLMLIAKSVAATANATWSAEVLSRKTTIAGGSGTVHGRDYVLDNWGLNIACQAGELTGA